jgi:hypothetical protein
VPRGQQFQTFAANVHSGIEIAIQMSTATTRPVSIRQGERIINRAAHVTGFAGRIPAINNRQMSAIPDRLVFQLPSELAEGGIGYRFSQLGSRKAVDAEVLNRDAFVFHHQPGGQLMQEILALVRRLTMRQRYRTLGAQLPRAAFYAPAEGPLCFAEFPFSPTKEPGGGNAFAVR